MENKVISNYDYKLIKQIFSMTEKALLASMPKVLANYYDKDNVVSTEDYIYVKGDIPIALVAHLDTVHRCRMTNLFHDRNKRVLWSSEGLGADDRAGVFAILKILEDGYRPSIILCSQEENGGIGATNFVDNFPKPAVKTNFLIELDRQGSNDSVYYDYDNPLFEDYINEYGFITDWGTFSDISVISPVWRLPAVNLSIGYYHEHSLGEIMYYNQTFATIQKVENILAAEMEEDHIFEYIEYKYDGTHSSFFSKIWGKSNKNSSLITCDMCGAAYSRNVMVPVIEQNCTFNICPMCVQDNVSWCNKCGRSYLQFIYPDYDMCPECLEGSNLDD